MSCKKSPCEREFPVTVKRGSVEVKIYRTPTHNCERFTLCYYQNGTRRRPSFSSFDEAKSEAETVATLLASGDSAILTLTGADRLAYQRARQHLDPLGVAIEIAAAEYSQAKKRLGGVALSEAVEFYLKRNSLQTKPCLVSTVANELIASKESDGLSNRYLNFLRWSMKKFMRAFGCNIGEVSAPQIDDWLRESGLSPRTRNNLRSAVQTLFKYAKARRYIPKDNDEVDSVQRVKNRGGKIEIFEPWELEEITVQAGERLIPFVVLGAFAGIRHAELQRLDWREIRIEDGIIEIKAENAKTASRRTIPISENLRQWLLEHRKDSGPVCVYQDTASELKRITKRINEARRAAWALTNRVGTEEMKKAEKSSQEPGKEGKRGTSRRGEIPPGAKTAKAEGWKPFKWKRNALRHSFISYRIAEVKNVPQVALEAGNSPQIIFSNYRELVRPADAQKWFSIVPGETSKIIRLPKAGTANSELGEGVARN